MGASSAESVFAFYNFSCEDDMKLIDRLMFRRSARAQAGFTMVELAIVLVVAGMMLVAVLKGTDTINKAKVERAVADLKGLQSMLLETQKRISRLPGDCNNDGTIALYPLANRTFLASAAEPIVDATNRSVCTRPADDTYERMA
jgi:prepilin-type N-terminal cleavage/methylation domain-containing protein